jgi:hypothetical protein
MASVLGGIAMGYHSPATAVKTLATFSIVGTMKKKGIKLDEEEEKAFAAMDEALSEGLKGYATAEQLEEKLKAIPKAGMTEEQVKAFEEIEESLKKQAVELSQMKTNGIPSLNEDMSFRGQIKKQLLANKEMLTKMAETGVGTLNVYVKAAATQLINTTTAYTNAATQPLFPAPEIIPGLTDLVRNQPFILQIMDVSGTSSPNIDWMEKINPQGAALWVDENTLSPLVSFDIEINNSRAKMITDSIKISTQMLDDVPFMAAEIEKELMYQMRIKIDADLLSGDGAGANLKGIASYVGGYVLTTVKTDNPNNSDCVLAAATQIARLNFMANVCAMNPIDVANTKLLKGSTGYYVVNPNDTNGTMAGIRVIESNQIPVGKILVMDNTRTNVRILQDMKINFGWENDDFRKHLVTVMADMRMHNYIKANHVGAFVYDDLANIKAAIANA